MKKTIRSNKQRKIIFILIALVIIFTVIKIQDNNKNNLLPDYDLKELENVEKEVNELQNEYTVSFSFITDIHINNEGNTHNNIIAFSKASNNKLIKFAAVGGDLYSAYNTNHEQGIEQLKYVYNFLHKEIKKNIYFSKGNHDCNAKLESSEYIQNNEYYDLVIKDIEKDIVTNSEDKSGGYYYKDFEENKIRLCVLNSFEGEGQDFIFNEKELEFVANNMLNFENKDNPREWQVLFISHTAIVSDLNIFNEIVKAYQNGEKVKINSREIDYSKQGSGTVIAFIAGHSHVDYFDYDNGYLYVVVQRGFNTLEEINTKEELGFSVFTIDTKSHILYETRCGRGNSRLWNYKMLEEELIDEAA